MTSALPRLALLLCATLPWPVQAQNAVDAEPAPSPIPLSLTVSGGVSMGAYEAGLLYYSMESLKANPGLAELKLATGASAGSVNAILAAISLCSEEEESPTESYFWKTWIPLGLDAMLPSDEVGADLRLGALSRTALVRQAQLIEVLWKRGLSEKCDLVIAIPVTRVKPRQVFAVGDRLGLNRTEEKFTVRVRGRGLGQEPLITNYGNTASAMGTPLLVTDDAGRVAFSELRDLVLASSAFPIAFPPQPVRHCLSYDETPLPEPRCLATEAQTELFIDGGVLDNGPLRAAARIASAGLASGEEGALSWRPIPDSRPGPIDERLFFTFVTIDAVTWPPPPVIEGASETLAGIVQKVLSGFVDSARSKELNSLLEEYPGVAKQAFLPRRHLPSASEPLGYFFGFFEEQFRSFDFALGMYDGWRVWKDEIGPMVPDFHGGPLHVATPSSVHMKELAWREFACMRAVLEGDTRANTSVKCAGDDLEGFRILLQVALERLFDLCGRAEPSSAASSSTAPLCAAAVRGEEPPRLPWLAVDASATWRRREGEGELSYAVRRLSAHRFDYKDLGIGRASYGKAMTVIRERVRMLGDRLTAVQPLEHRGLLSVAVKAGADTIYYAPPGREAYLTFGPSLELGGSHAALLDSLLPAGMRLAGAASLGGLGGVLSSGESPWSLELTGGILYQPPALSSIAAQLLFGLRAGYLLASGDDFSTRRCPEGTPNQLGGCSRPVLQLLVAGKLIERVRLQVVGEWFPPTEEQDGLWAISPGLGLQIAW